MVLYLKKYRPTRVYRDQEGKISNILFDDEVVRSKKMEQLIVAKWKELLVEVEDRKHDIGYYDKGKHRGYINFSDYFEMSYGVMTLI